MNPDHIVAALMIGGALLWLAVGCVGAARVVGTGAGGDGDPAPTEATLWVNRSVDCPEAPAQAHHSGVGAGRGQ